jgi:hypothetical protein
MEAILELYAEPYDARHPVVCFDERPYQMVEETRMPLPARPGKPERYDFEYKRQGTCNLFVFFQPLKGWRKVKVTERRTKVDFAHCMRELVDDYFPQADRIRLVLDNLNIHTPVALYETFPPEEARRILRKLEFHATPKHGSWLNMVEIELSVLSRQCLGQWIPRRERVKEETHAWERERNQKMVKVYWQFTIPDARTKLMRFYPS